MKNKKRISDAFSVLFLAVFAMPFLGGYLMLDEGKENKLLGTVLLLAGLMIWFLFGIN